MVAARICSVVSWVFFGLALLTALAAGAFVAAMHSASADPHAAPAAGILAVIGVAGAWMIALALAGVGALSGLIGLAGDRTAPAWAAFLLNAAVVAVSVVLLLVL